MYYVISLIIAAVLALIPANIAKNKGKSFGLWWFYGWLLFIVALIHSLLLPDPNVQTIVTTTKATSRADEIMKYKKLLDSGVITQEEFEVKKKQLLDL